jgi:hypothetical protein
LAGHDGDAVEVRVVVKDGHLASALVFGREQPLNVSRPSQVIGGRLDQLEDSKRTGKPIPFESASGGVADLKVADPGSCELAALGPRLDCYADGRC